MKDKVDAAVEVIRTAIDETSETLGRPDYIEFIAELSAHLRCLQDCIDDEEGDSHASPSPNG